MTRQIPGNKKTETMKNKIEEIKKALDGCEVESLMFEGVVGVDNGVVTRAYDGKQMKMSDRKWKILEDEYFENEFGGMSIEDLL